MSLRGREMKDGSKHIMCEEHGTATTTYVCSHLVDDPLQRWHSDRASPDNPWPDAWCDRCNVKSARDGEWNESNSDGIEIQILCNYCYEGALGKSVSRLKKGYSSRIGGVFSTAAVRNCESSRRR
jgi:hypothetical protein